jgi:hypothetical protein
VLAEPPSRQLADGCRGQRRGSELEAALGRERGQQLAVVVGPRRAGRHDQRERQLAGAARQVHEEAQRRRVGPVRVVGHEEQRAAGGQVRAQPVQAVDGGELGVRARVRLGGRVDERRGQRGRAAQQLGALGGVQRAAEQPVHQPERPRSLQRARAGRQHPQLARDGTAAGGIEQRRLADPGRPAHERHAAAPARRGVHQRRELGQLALSLQQRGGGR